MVGEGFSNLPYTDCCLLLCKTFYGLTAGRWKERWEKTRLFSDKGPPAFKNFILNLIEVISELLHPP